MTQEKKQSRTHRGWGVTVNGSLATPKGSTSNDSIHDPHETVKPSQDLDSHLASIVPQPASTVDTDTQTDYDNGNLT